ncbi:solute carrier family [Lynx pardinus]|uniref:Solute carrier family n=1 Tax=Lynx pardinus TaxID=191816 RepID=A0A485PB82_LYNPA|nr:solute carrier family [Lynx pardinus]
MAGVITAAQNVWMLLGGRLLTGVACGIASLVAPVYISEIAYPAVRGLLGSCVQLMVVTGILLAYLAGFAVGWGPIPWLLMSEIFPLHVKGLATGVCVLTNWFMAFLVTKEFSSVMVSWYIPCPGLLEEPETAMNAVDRGFRLAQLRLPSIYKPFIIGVSLMAFQQLSGINAVMFYAETIFEEAKFKESSLASVIVGIIQVLFTAMAALIMDKAGRRLLLTLSDWRVFAKATTLRQEKASQAPLRTRPRSMGALTECLLQTRPALTDPCITTPAPWSRKALPPGASRSWLRFEVQAGAGPGWEVLRPYGAFWLASAFCIFSVLFTLSCVPETKGKTLEQITAHFEGR